MVVGLVNDYVARLAETAGGAPFYAAARTIRRTPRIRRDYVEVLLVVGGRGRMVRLEEARRATVHALERGSLVVVRAQEDVQFLETGEGGMSTLYVSFSEADWGSFAGTVGLDPASLAEPPVVTVEDAQLPALAAEFEHAIHCFAGNPSMLDLVRFLTGVVPVLLPADRTGDPGTAAPGWLAGSLELMRDEDNLRAGLPRLLEFAHVTASHLGATTRRYFGKTPTALLLDLRLRHAASLLAATEESVQTVARRCGFENLPHFSTTFRRAYQTSPREYRARCRIGAARVTRSA
jgi:AraC-like DNA-binding protein